MDYKIKLVVKLKDGRILSGTYHYIQALARLDFAASLPLFDDAHMEAA